MKLNKNDKIKYNKRIQKAAKEINKYFDDEIMAELILDAISMEILCGLAWEQNMTLEMIKADIIDQMHEDFEMFGVFA